MPKEFQIITIANNQDSSYQDAYKQFISCNHKLFSVAIDLHNFDITQHQSAILFGGILIEKAYREVALLHLKSTRENIQNIFDGVCLKFLEIYPNGVPTLFGSSITVPQIEIENAFGEGKYSSIKLGLDVFQAIVK